MVGQEDGVFLSKSIKEAEQYVEKLFSEGKESASLCPYYNIRKEYRCFYLNGEVLLIYGKEKPYIIGNGKDTVEKLCKKINKTSKFIENSLDYKYIPQKNEKVYLSWKHNLSRGATPEILEKGELYNKIEDIAINAAKAINIKFATVDVIETEEDKLYVMEINSGVGATKFSQQVEHGYEITKEIYRKALKLLFE